MDPWGLLILVGSVGFILCLVPQLVRTLRTRRADDLAWGFLVLVLFSSACTFPYAVHKAEWALAASQGVNLLVWGVVAMVKLKGARKR